MSHTDFPSGVWPAMITPLNADRSIDWAGVDRLTDWYIDAGVAGLFAVGQSSEMFKMDGDERLRLARRVTQRTNGRAPVVASGTFGGPIEEQADFVRRMFDTGVQAVTVLASALARPDETDDVWWDRLEQLLALTGSIPLALYECPQPYHRLIAPELVKRAAAAGRFRLLKETSRSLDAVIAKVDASAGAPLGIFTADATTLLPSLRAGAQGYCGIAANFYPDLVVWLCKHFETREADHVHAVLGTADFVIHSKYPVSAKFFLRQAGFDILTHSRVTDAELTDYDQRVLTCIAAQVSTLRQTLQV